MRVPVSLKVFAVFCALAATTTGLGVVVFFGARDLRQASAELQTTKEFQVRVEKLELFTRARKLRASDPEAFGGEFDAVRTLAASIARLAPELPGRLRPRVTSLDEHLGYVHTAFRELFAHYAADRRAGQAQRNREEALRTRLANLPPQAQLRVYPPVQLLENLTEQCLADYDPALLPRIRAAAAEIRRLSPDRELTRHADRLILNAEEAFLNHLAIVDKERFLADAADRFSEIATQAIEAISRASEHRQRQLTLAVAIAVASSALLTLLFWAAARRYIRRALAQIHGSIQSIRSGVYDYPVPAVPDDEVGDLTLFLRELAGSLEQSLRRARESEEKFRSLVEDVSDWVWETDGSGRLVYASPVVGHLLGVDPAAVLGETLDALLSGDDADRVAGLLAQSLAEKRPARSVEASVVRPDGSRAVLESSWQPVEDDQGRLQGLRGISRDVTERKRAEEEQARLRSQLLQAQKMEAIGTLTGGIAHDFNNLLQSIGGYTEMLLRRKAEDDPDRSKLQTIEKATRRAADLTRQLLVFGRKVETQAGVLNLNDEVTQVRDLLGRTIPKMVEIRTRLAPGLWKVSADPTQIEQVLVNLAVNAKDAMPEGGVLEFATENLWAEAGTHGGPPDLPPGRYVCLTVTDTGHGMDADTLEHAFEPFFTTKDVGKGTGLGLAMVYGIVQSHQGRILCQSAPRRGTTFHVYLPALQAEERPAMDTRPAPAAPAEGGGETLLVVDDEEPLLELAEEILGEAGYETLRAESGEAALSLLRSGAGVDLVLLDLNMPGMGGLECLRQLREITPDLRVLVASGYPAGPLRADLALLGAGPLLRKPYRAADLLSAVRESLDHAS
ncbi:MAG: PAS domain S-box protein [Deltaproteobacteria bacterium]|nr:PAS domain S-box protein [Deltaproteobacteria bacterium]